MHFQELEVEEEKKLPQMTLKHKFEVGAMKWRLLK